MRRSLFVLCSVVFLASIAAHAQFQPQYDPRMNLGNPGQDEDFLKSAMNTTSAEIEWSKIASAKAANPEVKALANQTVTEAMPVAGRLVAEAKAAKVKVPDGVSGKYKKESDKLNGLSGDAFDKEYVSALVKAQHDDVGAMREEAKASKNASLQDFATRTGDQVTQRNDQAIKLQKQLGAK
jgi:putative membrane protein